MIVGSDGLWEKMTDSVLINVVKKYYQDKLASEKICKDLVSISTGRWNKECIYYRDDISCVVVILNNKH